MALLQNKKRRSQTVPDLPLLDLAITVLTFMLFVLVIWFCLEDHQALVEFLGGILLTILAIAVCKKALVSVGKHLGTQRALKKPRNLRKFADQGWQLAIHVTMTAYEWRVLESVDWVWWNDLRTLWPEGAGLWHQDQQLAPAEWEVRRIYLLQLAIWFVTSFAHKFIDAKHKDYFVMYTHHVITIALLVLSWKVSCMRVGILVLLLHDASDIAIDILKMVNYLGLDEQSGLYLSEVTFIANLFVWAYTRLYLYPMVVIRSTLPSSWGGALDHALPFDPGWASSALTVNSARLLLCMLALMHWWWYYLLLRILYRLFSHNAHDAGRDEYEGSSDSDSQTEDEELKKQ